MPRRRLLLVAGVAALLLAAAGTAYLLRPPPAVTLDPNQVAVIPFRVKGAAPALGYLREGMIDLVAARLTGEGGVRATDPRSVMTAWRGVVRSEDEDLPEGAASDIARRLGAGQLLLGGVVGSPGRVVINASLFPVGNGKARAQASVEGTADSLPALVDRLIAQLIAGESGARSGLAGFAGTPLSALRPYLEGQAAYRRGDYAASVARLEEALEQDSTLALAGLWLATAAGWTNAPGAARRGLELAWANGDRLSPRDSALLIAEVGPRYPRPSPLAEYLAAWERAVDLAPDQPDRWYELGDVYFHDGPYLGIKSSRQRAAEAFRRSVAIDSGAAPLGHLLEVAVLDGDTAQVRRLGAVYLTRDSAGDLSAFYQWRIATGLHDTLALRRLRERYDRITLSNLWRIMNHAALDGIGLDDADFAAAAIRRKAGSGSEWQRAKTYLRAFELSRGRPRAALADTAGSGESEYAPHAALYQRVLDALYGDGDSANGAQAAELLGRYAERSPVDLCVSELWRVEQGRLGTATRTIARLRSPRTADDSPEGAAIAGACATILEAVAAAGGPEATPALQRVDSLLRAGPGGMRNGPAIAFTLSPGFAASTIGISPVGFEEFANLIAARLHERQGDPEGALAAVRRRAYAYHRIEYLATHLREEGRLAALTGDRPGAVRAYRHYLALRSDPEPALRPEVEKVRAELVKLDAPP